MRMRERMMKCRETGTRKNQETDNLEEEQVKGVDTGGSRGQATRCSGYRVCLQWVLWRGP